MKLNLFQWTLEMFGKKKCLYDATGFANYLATGSVTYWFQPDIILVNHLQGDKKRNMVE